MRQFLEHTSNFLANLWWRVALVFLLALTIYLLTFQFAIHPNHPPTLSYFNYLAEAFLQGHLDLVRPPSIYDLTFYAGRWYVPFPPLPALLMLPWVGWQGAKNTNVAYFSIFMGAINVSLVFLLLETMSKRGWTGLSSRHNLGLTLLFGMGSVHWYLSIMGEVWFVSQICTVTFVILASWLAVANRSPWLSGVALALAMLGRPTIVFSWPLLLGIAAQDLKDRSETSSIEWRRWLKWTLASAIPLVLALVALLAYNFLRFDNLTDFGYVAQNVNPRLVASLREYGQFNLYYLGANLDAMLLALPRIDLAAKVFEPDLRGMSLLLTMPALIYLVRARKASPLVSGTWTAVALLLVPLLT